MIYVPFVQDSAIVVNAVLAVRMNISDTAWRMLYASHYESFGFEATTNGEWNARNVFQFFALFQYEIFGHTKFLIKDKRLFNTTIDTTFITLKQIDGVTVNRSNRTSEVYQITRCGWWSKCGGDPPPAEAKSNRINDCWEVRICNTYYYDDGPDLSGGTDWTGASWTYGNGGGGGSGVWSNGDPCANQSSCTAAWTPTNDYATINGVTYTSESYPGINEGFPWLWWDNPYYDFIVPANLPNLDLTDYLKCFTNDPSFTYKITVAVDQPVPGTRTTYTKNNGGSSASSSKKDVDAGHTFLILQQVYPNGITVTRNLGFYPDGGVNPIAPNANGEFKNDQGHNYDVSLTTTVTAAQFMQLLDIVKNSQNEGYNLNNNNCSSFCTKKLSQIGINLPETIGNWPGGSGINPGDLGEDIRAMQLQSNQTRNTTGGPAPANNVTC